MLAATVVALLLYVTQRSPTRGEFTTQVERALMSGGLIILITSAGGAFGAMLQAAQIGPAIQALFGESQSAGALLLFLGFAIASLLKFAQGSSTVAENISGVADAAGDTSQAAGHLLQASQGASDQTEELRNVVDGFLERVSAA